MAGLVTQRTGVPIPSPGKARQRVSISVKDSKTVDVSVPGTIIKGDSYIITEDDYAAISAVIASKYLGKIDDLQKAFSRLELRVQTKATDAWFATPEYVPEQGDIVIFSDHSSHTDEYGIVTYIPGIKIGDGITSVVGLPFASEKTMDELIIADKLAHSITIGEYVFDGSEDVIIPVYKGE